VHEITVLKRKAHTEDNDGKSPHPMMSMNSAATVGGSMRQYIIQKSENKLLTMTYRIVSPDGLPFRLFATSSDLRTPLMALGFASLPYSANGIKHLVVGEGDRVRSFVMGELTS